jgi:hypothetical protein
VCRKRVQACLLYFCLMVNGAACWLLSFLEFVVKRARAQSSDIGPVAFIPDLRMVSIMGFSFSGMEYLPDSSF